jgi:cardiolipin synthase A/B
VTIGTWKDGNRVRLLENGEEYFPRVFEAIGEARSEVFVETFILFDDKVGRQLRAALIGAAQRGVRVELTVDGYGSPDISGEFIGPLLAAGAHVHVFDPRRRLLGFRMNIFRRMHRKMVVIDGRRAFVGGLNFSFDHLREFGPEAKQDYAVEVEGPVVNDIRELAAMAVAPPGRWWRRRALAPPRAALSRRGSVAAVFVTRDNEQRRDEIELHYRNAIRAAQREIVVANAYFFPGYRLLRELRSAAQRGVKVCLILQGRPDMPLVRWVALALYDYLLQAGVRIYEFCERPLHAKVAVIDGDWATVGSSNLDPLSLFLNLEANIVVRDAAFGRRLRERLHQLMEKHCSEITPERAPPRTPWRQFLSVLAFHFVRRFPTYAGWLPGHREPPRVRVVSQNDARVPPKKEAA